MHARDSGPSEVLGLRQIVSFGLVPVLFSSIPASLHALPARARTLASTADPAEVQAKLEACFARKRSDGADPESALRHCGVRPQKFRNFVRMLTGIGYTRGYSEKPGGARARFSALTIPLELWWGGNPAPGVFAGGLLGWQLHRVFEHGGDPQRFEYAMRAGRGAYSLRVGPFFDFYPNPRLHLPPFSDNPFHGVHVAIAGGYTAHAARASADDGDGMQGAFVDLLLGYEWWNHSVAFPRLGLSLRGTQDRSWFRDAGSTATRDAGTLLLAVHGAYTD